MARKKSKDTSIGGILKSGIETALGIKSYDGQIFLFYPRKREVGSRINEYDPISRRIYLLVFFLAVLGVVVQYSASYYMCANDVTYNNNPLYFVKKQIVFEIVAFAAIWVMQHINYQIFFSRLAWILYIFSVVSLGLLKTSLGQSANGATRWVRIAGFQFAPSELVKVAVVVMLANLIQHFSRYLGRWWFTAILWLVGGVPAILLLEFGNNLSSAMVVLFITFGITLLTTRTWKMHLLVIIAGIAFLVWYVYPLYYLHPTVQELSEMSFRKVRIIVWLHPEEYYSSNGWQVCNTLYASGAGGLFGNGLGSFQLLKNNVPYAYTDVIFCVILYEFGIAGALVFLSLYLFLARQISQVAMDSETLFGGVICSGYMIHICVQVLLHIAVVLNLMPNTGQTLPWISYSGTAFLCLGIEIGFILSVSRQHLSSYADAELSVGQ